MLITSKRIYLSSPHMSGGEMKYIDQAFAQNWVSPLGPNVDAFEESLARYCGVKHAAALSSGTAAIHLALIILGIKPGDEVIASSFTFSATVNPIVYQGATPILIDSEPGTWNMDPELLEDAIKSRRAEGRGQRVKAIIPVHLYGMPANMGEIMKIADKYEIPVIEDAAEALGSRFNGKQVGSFGKMVILSFNGNKIITTSGGGALLSNYKDLIAKARFLATQARDKAPHYQHSQIGYNYRMSNILAGIGRGQMEVIEDRVKRRRDTFSFYKKNLSIYEGIKFIEEPDESYFSNRWLTTVLIDPSKTGISREDLQINLEKENIETRPLWKPMHLQPVFSSCPSYLNGVSLELFSKGLCLPSGSNMSDDDRMRVLDSIIKNLHK
jgi:dTDP-4-amino-4,6-dideoxygalactose transaminase